MFRLDFWRPKFKVGDEFHLDLNINCFREEWELPDFSNRIPYVITKVGKKKYLYINPVDRIHGHVPSCDLISTIDKYGIKVQ